MSEELFDVVVSRLDTGKSRTLAKALSRASAEAGLRFAVARLGQGDQEYYNIVPHASKESEG